MSLWLSFSDECEILKLYIKPEDFNFINTIESLHYVNLGVNVLNSCEAILFVLWND